MLWTDLDSLLGDMIGQPLRTDGRFTPTSARLTMHEIQAEISEVAKCVETSNVGVTVSGTATYDLPSTCIEVFAVGLSGYEAPIQIHDIPLPASALSGTPTMWYIIGNKIGFYPVPNAAITYTLYFYKRPPEYAMRVTHALANASSTACVMSTTATGMTLVITGGTDAGTTTINFAHASTDTVAEVVAKINGLAKGFTATAHPDAGSLVFTTEGVDVRTSINIEGVNDYVFFNPQIPTRARDLLLNGSTERMKLKDREINFEQYQASMYYKKLAEFKADWKSRKSKTRNMGIQRTRRRGGGGGEYIGDSGIPRVFIT